MRRGAIGLFSALLVLAAAAAPALLHPTGSRLLVQPQQQTHAVGARAVRIAPADNQFGRCEEQARACTDRREFSDGRDCPVC